MAQREYHTLSERIVDGLSVSGKDAIFWDRDLLGFGVRVYPSGKKVFVVQTCAVGRSKRVTLGEHGNPPPQTLRGRSLPHKRRLDAVEILDHGREVDACVAQIAT